MNSRLSLLLFVLLACMTGVGLHAQDIPASSGGFRLGLSAGATYNNHPGIAEGQILSPTDPTETSTTWEFGYSTGLVAEYLLNPRFSLVSHILYSTHPGSGMETIASDVLLPSGLVHQVVRAEVDARYDILSLDLLGKVRIISMGESGAGIAVGLSLGRVMSLQETRIGRLIEPEGERFTNPDSLPTREGGRVIVFAENEDVENVSSTRLSIRGGLFYDLKLSERLRLTPGAYFDYGLTSLVAESDWGLNFAMFQLDVTAQL